MPRELRVIEIHDGGELRWSAGNPASPDEPDEPHAVHDSLNAPHANAEAIAERVGLNLTDEIPVFVISDFLGLTSESRRNFFATIANLRRAYRIRRAGTDVDFDDVFDFVLAAMEADRDVTRCEVGRQAAVEAAACFHPYAVVPCASRIARRLHELGVTGVRVTHLQAEIRGALTSFGAGADGTRCHVLDTFPGAPVTPETVMPPLWTISTTGIHYFGIRVSATPMIIAGRAVDIATRIEHVELAYYRDAAWHQRRVRRDQLTCPSSLRRLSTWGIDVTCYNAKTLVAYFRDFERANVAAIPMAWLSNRLGWHDLDGADVFLLPHELITDAQEPQSPTRERLSRTGIVYQPPTHMAGRLVQGLRSGGSYSRWLDAMELIAPYLRIRLALYVSLVPPLLSILDTMNFVLDLAGPTSVGKTAALRIAASAWGVPIEYSPDSIIFTWDSTQTFREEAASTLNGLPFLLDETGLAAASHEVQRLVYSIVEGRGRGRSAHCGMTSVEDVATVLIATGERSLRSIVKTAGAKARILSLWGSPFQGRSGQISELVGHLRDSLRDNFGFAGPMFLRELTRHRDEWDWLRADFRRRISSYVQRAGDNPVACRLVEALGAIDTAAWLAHRTLGLPFEYIDVVSELWSELIGSISDEATAALERAVSWARAHPDSFYDRRRPRTSQPAGGWAGRWDEDGAYIGFMPETLERILVWWGYDLDAVIRAWREREWIITNSSTGKARLRARVGRKIAWLIAISESAIRAIDEQGGDEGEVEVNAMNIDRSVDPHAERHDTEGSPSAQ